MNAKKAVSGGGPAASTQAGGRVRAEKLEGLAQGGSGRRSVYCTAHYRMWTDKLLSASKLSYHVNTLDLLTFGGKTNRRPSNKTVVQFAHKTLNV